MKHDKIYMYIIVNVVYENYLQKNYNELLQLTCYYYVFRLMENEI